MTLKNINLLKIVDKLVDYEYSFTLHYTVLGYYITLDYSPEFVEIQPIFNTAGEFAAYSVILGKDSDPVYTDNEKELCEKVHEFVENARWLEAQKIIAEDEY